MREGPGKRLRILRVAHYLSPRTELVRALLGVLADVGRCDPGLGHVAQLGRVPPFRIVVATFTAAAALRPRCLGAGPIFGIGLNRLDADAQAVAADDDDQALVLVLPGNAGLLRALDDADGLAASWPCHMQPECRPVRRTSRAAAGYLSPRCLIPLSILNRHDLVLRVLLHIRLEGSRPVGDVQLGCGACQSDHITRRLALSLAPWLTTFSAANLPSAESCQHRGRHELRTLRSEGAERDFNL